MKWLQQWWHFYLGRVCLMLGREGRAIRELGIALEIDPQFSLAASSLGLIHGERRRYAQAIECFRQALEGDPANADTLFNLGYACERSGQYGEALAAFRKAVEIKPKSDLAWYGLGLCYGALADHAQAAAAFEQAAALQPFNPHAWYNLGMAHHALGDRAKVKEIVKRLSEFDPKMTRKLMEDTSVSDRANGSSRGMRSYEFSEHSPFNLKTAFHRRGHKGKSREEPVTGKSPAG